jgi:putative peptidoglycan lipid II flippase|tara:strand:+ start:12443 stop:14104 length:1662 start_codon:yes stop_codon:yes gene_type:complete
VSGNQIISDQNRPSGRNALIIGGAILLSRLSGLIRELILAGLLGTRVAADAFKAALQIPGLLQNILGEGTLSASFIPTYSRLIDDENSNGEAGVVAGTVATLLGLVTSAIVLIGILAARPLTKVLLPLLPSETFELTVNLVRIMWSGLGFIVLSSWCLGVLNAHRRFFLSFAAPILWNAAQIIFALVAWGQDWSDASIAKAAAWGVLIGGALQFLIQIPLVIKVSPSLKLGIMRGSNAVREIISKFFPAVLGRGVVQFSGFLDLFLAGFLATGAFTALSLAQIIYMLPIGLFVMSIISADLPELSRDRDNALAVERRFFASSERIAFYLVFSTFAFIAMGEPLIDFLFERGQFNREDTLYIWIVLGAYSLGLYATGMSRLYQNVCYSYDDVKGPARLASLRVLIAGLIGFLLMFQLERLAIDNDTVITIGDLPSFSPLPELARSSDTSPQPLGALGLAIGSSIAAWFEYFLLRKRVTKTTQITTRSFLICRFFLLPGFISAIVAGSISFFLFDYNAYFVAPLALLSGGITYTFGASILGSDAAKEFLKTMHII